MELYVPIERPDRNFVTGRFLKGRVPHNKGKKMSDYLDEETIKKCKEAGLKNLKSNRNLGGWNKRAVVAIYDERVVGWFPSASEAARKVGVSSASIRNVCYGLRKRVCGFEWRYEDELG